MEYTDTVTLGSGLTIRKQSLGVASTVTPDFAGIDGIFGFVSLVQTAVSLITFITVALVLLTSLLVRMYLF